MNCGSGGATHKSLFKTHTRPWICVDASVQAQVLNLMRRVKRDYSLAMLFFSHDLSVVKNTSDRVAVMYLGNLAEMAPTDAHYSPPRHPYTRILLDAIPEPTARK